VVGFESRVVGTQQVVVVTPSEVLFCRISKHMDLQGFKKVPWRRGLKNGNKAFYQKTRKPVRIGLKERLQANGMFNNRFKELVSVASGVTKQRRLHRMPQPEYPRDVRSSIKKAREGTVQWDVYGWKWYKSIGRH
jgi:hypothetical protein